MLIVWTVYDHCDVWKCSYDIFKYIKKLVTKTGFCVSNIKLEL